MPNNTPKFNIPYPLGTDPANISSDIQNLAQAVDSLPYLPSQSGNNGKYLTTDGLTPSWEVINALPSQENKSGRYLTTNGIFSSWSPILYSYYTFGNPIGSAITSNNTYDLQFDMSFIVDANNYFLDNEYQYYSNDAIFQNITITRTNSNLEKEINICLFKEYVGTENEVTYQDVLNHEIIRYSYTFVSGQNSANLTIPTWYPQTNKPKGDILYLYLHEKENNGSYLWATLQFTGAVIKHSILPLGGNAGQILSKLDSTNYNVQWIDVPATVPDQFGNNGKYLTTDGTNTSWSEIGIIPSGGTTGQVLSKISDNDYSVDWINVGDANLPSQAGKSGGFLQTYGETADWKQIIENNYLRITLSTNNNVEIGLGSEANFPIATTMLFDVIENQPYYVFSQYSSHWLDINPNIYWRSADGSIISVSSLTTKAGGNNWYVTSPAGAEKATFSFITSGQAFNGSFLMIQSIGMTPDNGDILFYYDFNDNNITNEFVCLSLNQATTSIQLYKNNLPIPLYSASGTNKNYVLSFDAGGGISWIDLSDKYFTQDYINNTYLTQIDASNTYLTQMDLSSTYLTTADASNIYLNQTDASNTFLNQVDASNIYLNQTDASNTFLNQVDANNTYFKITDANNFKSIPPGGGTGQVLSKIDNNDYSVEWINISGLGVLPTAPNPVYIQDHYVLSLDSTGNATWVSSNYTNSFKEYIMEVWVEDTISPSSETIISQTENASATINQTDAFSINENTEYYFFINAQAYPNYPAAFLYPRVYWRDSSGTIISYSDYSFPNEFNDTTINQNSNTIISPMGTTCATIEIKMNASSGPTDPYDIIFREISFKNNDTSAYYYMPTSNPSYNTWVSSRIDEDGVFWFGYWTHFITNINEWSPINLMNKAIVSDGFRWRVRDYIPKISTQSLGKYLTNDGTSMSWSNIFSAYDIEITDTTKGIVLKSPNGTRYRITIDDSGTLTTSAIP